jgi:hypothetical protein
MRAAVQYLEAGLSVVPLQPNKKQPLVRWREFQDRRPSVTEVQTWWTAWPAAGIAIVCGRVSELAVLDEDPRHGGDRSLARYPLPEGPVVLTGGGGRHFYFALNGEHVPRIGALLPGVDLLGEGALATAPPSVHPCGAVYRWAPGRALGEVPLPPLPFWLRGLLSDRRAAPRPCAGSSGSAGAPLAVEAALARLDGVRRAGTGWTARCPAHEDHVPSLSVGVGVDGRLLLHCFAGCAFDTIRASLEARA